MNRVLGEVWSDGVNRALGGGVGSILGSPSFSVSILGSQHEEGSSKPLFSQ